MWTTWNDITAGQNFGLTCGRGGTNWKENEAPFGLEARGRSMVVTPLHSIPGSGRVS